jgi:SOS-response transcriptional repressor LexA
VSGETEEFMVTDVADREKWLHPVARAILRLIDEHVAEHGFPPTVRELLRELPEDLDVTSTSTVHHHLSTLKGVGLIRGVANKSRAYTRIKVIA